MTRICDAHCDTISRIYEKNQFLRSNDGMLDLERMPQGIQVFAAFIDKKNIKCTPMNYCIGLIEKYHDEIEKNSERISECLSYTDAERVIRDGGRGSILSIEGGEALEGNIAALDMYYRLGVRLITLTWNYANELADGITEERGGGLTAFGREAVARMNELGIIADVSHLSERGFWDVMEVTSKPVAASHSNAKALCPHHRNLTDEQIAALIKNRGFIGINFCPAFLDKNLADLDMRGEDYAAHISADMSGAEFVISHIEYMFSLGAEENVGLGSDFDGIAGAFSDLGGVEKMNGLIEKIRTHISPDAAERVSHGNFMRFLSEAGI